MQFRKKTAKENNRENQKGKTSVWVILFSVFVALVLWFYVQDAEAPDYKKTFTSVAVEMQSLSPSFSVIDGGENTVDITLVGKRSDLNKIKAGDLEAYIDLSSVIQPGTYQKEISVLLPDGTELSECFPQNATLFVDQTVSKTVPVKVELGSYTVGENSVLEATPALSEIQVKGPKTVLDQVDHAQIVTEDFGTVTSSFESNLSYHLVNKNKERVEERHLVLPEANMKVLFSVFKTKTVPLTVECENGYWTKEEMKYTVTPSQILIKGEPGVVDLVESVPCVIVDEKTVDSSRVTLSVAPSQIPLPEGIRLGEVLGEIKVDLRISGNVGKNLTANLSSSRVAVTPPQGDLKYTFQSQTLTFRIRGNSANIYKATANDFYFNIDLSPYNTPGEVEVPVEIIQTSESEGKFYPVGAYTVKVTIQ